VFGKRWGLLFSVFFTAHLFAGPSPKFLKTACIRYPAKIALRPATVTTIRRRLIRQKMGGKRWGLLFSAFLTRALTGLPTDSGLRRFLIPRCVQD
jgi:hypothetical protein